jgi:hypothetical protein
LDRRPSLRAAAAAAVLASLLGACEMAPTFGKQDMNRTVREVCKKEYNFDVEARLTGKTLYVGGVLDGLVGRDLGLQQDTLAKLEGAMLSTTRAALSTDAEINFLAVKARDSRLGVTVTLLRYFPDVKSLIYMRISRADFETRLVLETDSALEPESPDAWREVTMTEFMSRLVASRLQRQFSSNPLITAFLRIRRVKGSFKAGVLSLQLDKFENEPETNLLVEEILRSAVEETVADVVRKYDAGSVLKRVSVKDDSGRQLLDLETAAFLEKTKDAPRPAALP